MRSVTASTPHLLFSHYSFVGLSSSLFPSVFLRRTVQRFSALNLVAVKETGLYWGCSGLVLRRCKDWDSEGDSSLEEDILEFMKNSSNPDAFPTRKQLVDSGRMDLADAIVKKGGWLAFGWDLGQETQERFGELDVEDGSSDFYGNEIRGSGVPSSSSSANYSQPAVSTGRSAEIEAEESGIEGILSRLEKERNNSLGHGFREEEDRISIGNYEDKDKWHQRTTRDVGQKNSSDDPLKLSDAWEFQKNEIMNAQDRLCSIRAKMAVLEGKMAAAIMDSHKIVEEKQKRIDYTHQALRLLKTTCVIWPTTGSEVLLAGSFDGWSTQRKMEKSSTGTFSVYLQLYPGKYEIKFIVDGEWKIDPLRPIVHNDNGYENNLLLIRD